MTKFLKLEGPLGDVGLVFHSLDGREVLGEPFEYRVCLLSSRTDLDPRNFLGQGCSITVAGSGGGTRSFHGLISEARQAGALNEAGQHQYEVVLRPHLWFLSRSKNSQIFQGQTVPQILKKVFDDHGLSDVKQNLQGSYPAREYCVQYQESAFDFVNRLMEEVGIYYYFMHAVEKHTLVLCDSAQSHEPAPGLAEIPYYVDQQSQMLAEYLENWTKCCEVQPETHVATDYNFEKPKVDLQVRQQGQELTAPGTGEYFEFPGLYLAAGEGEGLSRLRVEEWVSRRERFLGTGTARGPNAGLTFQLKGHPQSSLNQKYLVRGSAYSVSSSITAEQQKAGADVEFRCDHVVAPANVPYRSPRRTPRPRISGPQTALVVGPSGQELYCDKYGRVKVQFPWDRLGKKDENSSCWIRVAQAWAGKQWGAVFLPRIGHEVLVEFLEGDPDRPIVTGSVYNADLMPPYALPDNLSQSGLKTHSLNKGTDQTFNELRFEDKKDAEQVYLHAERDFDRVVENNDTLKVGFEKKDQGNQSIEVFNNQSTVVGHKEAKEGSQTLKVWLNQTIEVGGNQTLKVGFGGEGDKEDGGRTLKIAKDLTEDVGGSHQLTVKQDQKVTISQGNGTLKLDQGAQTIEAAKEILLKVGSNSIKIDQSGITIKAIKIELQADANISVKAQAQLAAEGALVGVKASGILTLQGSLTKIN